MCIIKDEAVHSNTVHGKHLVGEILAGYVGRAIDEENFGEKTTVSAYAIYVFHVSVNTGEENLGEWLTICQIHQFFLTKIFPCTVYVCPYSYKIYSYIPVYQTNVFTVASHDQ